MNKKLSQSLYGVLLKLLLALIILGGILFLLPQTLSGNMTGAKPGADQNHADRRMTRNEQPMKESYTEPARTDQGLVRRIVRVKAAYTGPYPNTRQNRRNAWTPRKPAVYLYPPQTMEVAVRLDYNGTLSFTYPDYGDGWKVVAQPDGTLTNRADGREYSYLFWEGETGLEYDFSEGFVVKGADTAAFLQEKLAFLGLTPREYNEFIVYWLPMMQNNPCNLISFQGKAYTDNAILTVEPQPDSVLRVFMAFKPLQEPIKVPEQQLQPFERKGFAVVEWGGSLVRE